MGKEKRVIVKKAIEYVVRSLGKEKYYIFHRCRSLADAIEKSKYISCETIIEKHEIRDCITVVHPKDWAEHFDKGGDLE